jgi:hypothetical protein
MDVSAAAADVLLGASLQQIASEVREQWIRDFQFRPEEVTADTFCVEVAAFMRKLARHLGDRHVGDARVGAALRDWVAQCDHYEAWDALLSGFDFAEREVLVRRGRVLFPGPLTAHWGDLE